MLLARKRAMVDKLEDLATQNWYPLIISNHQQWYNFTPSVSRCGLAGLVLWLNFSAVCTPTVSSATVLLRHASQERQHIKLNSKLYNNLALSLVLKWPTLTGDIGPSDHLGPPPTIQPSEIKFSFFLSKSEIKHTFLSLIWQPIHTKAFLMLYVCW